MQKTIYIERHGDKWKVTNIQGDYALVPSEREAILTAQFTAKDYPKGQTPKIVIKDEDGKEKTV